MKVEKFAENGAKLGVAGGQGLEKPLNEYINYLMKTIFSNRLVLDRYRFQELVECLCNKTQLLVQDVLFLRTYKTILLSN